MRNGRGAGRTPTRVSEGPKRGKRFSRCECVLRGDLQESEAQSFRSDPWAAVRRARLNPMQPVPDSGTKILQVSRHETLEKPETASIIARTTDRMEGFGRGNRPFRRESLAPT